ncbi:3086_t:CDS:2 [Funneliformis geosporum]|nr:3086_t:CDS:2 [Funneliformis geosporum]
MFFGPTLLSLQNRKNQIHVLCLSIGNESGLGELRKKELERSCFTLGIDVGNVNIIDHPLLQDGLNNNWDPSLISDKINDYVTTHRIDTPRLKVQDILSNPLPIQITSFYTN